MSQLWASYYADNVDRFRRLLSLTGHSAQAAAVWNANAGAGTQSIGGAGGAGSLEEGAGSLGSTNGLSASPRVSAGKGGRRASAYRHHYGGGSSKAGGLGGTLGKNEVNSRDHAGLTILLRAASSAADSALGFVQALLEHPAIDIYVQDAESGWNALHRALYAGNIAIARLLLEKERMDLAGQTLGASLGRRIGQLIKTKDHEGNSPFDLYNSTIGERILEGLEDEAASKDGEDSDSDSGDGTPEGDAKNAGNAQARHGEDLFFFGSNKNLTLGLGDGDDRQFPERVYLQRPDHLLHRFYAEHLEETTEGPPSDTATAPPREVANIPALVQGRPLRIRDVVLSKLHSAVVTTDPVSNLYVCGIGRSGRLGLGDENTRFSFVPVQGPLADKHVTHVALGQNHTMAVTHGGELWTWGSNACAQLGYTLPGSARPEEEAMNPTPRQVFGPLRKERILGVAASALHSVAHTGASLYCWGRNVGQLALMDADSRSLDVQAVPRKVAASLFSSPIVAVSAIDKATTCLLANHTVCVFTSYGYNIVKFSLAEPYWLGSNGVRSRQVQVNQIASGGETIAAVTTGGDLFTMSLARQKVDAGRDSGGPSAAASTTNPSKIRGALTPAQCVWTARKDGVRSVGVGEQGSVIISTHSGAVWRRVRRAKAKDAAGASSKKDYKFQRVPFITGVSTVRSSAFGAFAAVRCDAPVLRQQIVVGGSTLWDDVRPLHVLQGFTSAKPSGEYVDTLRFWKVDVLREQLGPVAYEILRSADLEVDLAHHLERKAASFSSSLDHFGAMVCTSTAPAIRIPVHSWMLTARSSVLCEALAQWRAHPAAPYMVSDVCTLEAATEKGRDTDYVLVTFTGLDLLSLVNLVLFLYEDGVVPVWNYSRQAPPLAHRYRQVRTEVMRVATRLNMVQLERAARVQTEPKRSLDVDLRAAVRDSRFFEDGDTVVELAGGAERRVHSVLMCQRCPWFEGLFHGRSRGQWLAGRRQQVSGTGTGTGIVRLDMKHMAPHAFDYVLRHLYGDVGAALFDPLVASSLEAFFDVVLEVLSIANELMLDRLSEVCQLVMGRFANTRNVAHLLNSTSGCLVHQFHDAGLEYVCLQMETMLENHLLDDLDPAMLQQLDAAVRANQRAQMPFSRSGRAEALLLERYPELAQDMDEEHQRRVREMAFRAALSTAPVATEDRRTRPSVDAAVEVSRNATESNPVPGRDNESEQATAATPTRPVPAPRTGSFVRLSASGKPILATPPAPTAAVEGTSGSPWRSPARSSSKLDLRAIMTESTGSMSSPPQPTRRISALSAGIDAQSQGEAALSPSKTTPTKLSQKERKKQQQQQQQQTSQAASTSKGAAWGEARPGSSDENNPQRAAVAAVPWKIPEAANKNMDGPQKTAVKRVHAGPRAASPDTRFAGQARPGQPQPQPQPPPKQPTKGSPSGSPSSPAQQPLVPHSKVYIRPAPKAEPVLGLSMADIIVQQQREQEKIREAVAKRSLEEIQQEQAFQEWWDQESRRTQEEEARRQRQQQQQQQQKNPAGRAGGRQRTKKGKAASGADKEESRTGGGGGGGSSTHKGRGGKNSHANGSSSSGRGREAGDAGSSAGGPGQGRERPPRRSGQV